MTGATLREFLRDVHGRPGGTGAVLNLIRGAKLHGAVDLSILGDLVREPDLRIEVAQHALDEARHAVMALERMEALGCRPTRLSPALDRVAGLFARCRARDVKQVHADRENLADVEIMELLAAALVPEEDAVEKLAVNAAVLSDDLETRAVITRILTDDRRHVVSLRRRLDRFTERFPRRVVVRTLQRMRATFRELDGAYYGALEGYFAAAAGETRAA